MSKNLPVTYEDIKTERHKIRKDEVDAYNERVHKLEEKEMVHEIRYGKRHNYLTEKTTNGPNKYRKKLLKQKVTLGKIDKSILTMKSSIELLDDWAKKRHCHSYGDYLNSIAIGRVFICYGEYEKVWSYYPGMPSPIKENRANTRFIGVYIAENGIAEIHEGSERMSYFNPGYEGRY